MDIDRWWKEKSTLQAIVAALALVPIAAGLSGIVGGPAFLKANAPWPADLDSHLRYLSGVLLAIGLAWYSCIPAIEAKSGRFRLLAGIVFVGGVARLLSLLEFGPPSAGHIAGLAIEVGAVPLVTLWQARIARLAST